MKVVLDTNVIVAALRSRRGAAFQVLLALRERRFEFVLSVPLFLEYEDVLKRPGMVPLSSHAIDRLLGLLAARGLAQDIFFLWRPFLRDPKDDMVLEVAVAAGCQAIVTFNGRDFVGVEQFGLEVLTAHQLLERLKDQSLEEDQSQQKDKASNNKASDNPEDEADPAREAEAEPDLESE
jgi:putative PIN family toxin of toxin-antitoxin system